MPESGVEAFLGRYIFKLPDVGEGVAEAELVAWHVALGDKVEEDQHLVDVMTDKATVEVGSPVAGTIAALHGRMGEKIPVGSPLAEIDIAGARASVPASEDEPDQIVSASQATPSGATAFDIPGPIGKSPIGKSGSRPLASPAVRRRARDHGIDLRIVRGSGPQGRITAADIEGHRAGDTVGHVQRDAVEEIQIIGVRRKIAEKMQAAKRHIPHFSYVEEVDVTELEELRTYLNAVRRDDQPRLTLLPFLMRMLVRLLPDYPQLNARFDDEAGVLRRYAAVHIGIATQTHNGLTVPVVRHAEMRDLWDCAQELARVAQAARDGSARREELVGSTITLTSLGPLGGIAHTPVINYPEVAIIGPNKIVERPVARQGSVVVRKMMNVSSSFDHRIVDGAVAAAFVQDMRSLLEHPAMIFMKQKWNRAP